MVAEIISLLDTIGIINLFIKLMISYLILVSEIDIKIIFSMRIIINGTQDGISDDLEIERL
jgi:hypothetical protein